MHGQQHFKVSNSESVTVASHQRSNMCQAGFSRTNAWTGKHMCRERSESSSHGYILIINFWFRIIEKDDCHERKVNEGCQSDFTIFLSALLLLEQSIVVHY
jgi:hypothetical protein